MLSWTLTFLIFALIAALLGFTGLAGAAVGIARILFVIFLVMFLVSLDFPKPEHLSLPGGIRGIFFSCHHRREHRHAARLFQRDQHVDGAVLQGLEAADLAADCRRVFRYSTVSSCIAAIAPTASAHSAAIASSTTRSISGNAAPGSPSTPSGPTLTFASVISAARRPSWVG